MAATEAFYYKNAAPGTQGPFPLLGGVYQITVVGFSSGSAVLKELAADGVTYLSCSETFTANGGDTIYLPPGQYEWVTVTDTLSLAVTRVPRE